MLYTVGGNPLRPSIALDLAEMYLVGVQTAATVLTACREYPRDGSVPQTGCGGIIAEYMPWFSLYGFINFLQAQVDLLYTLTEIHIKTRTHELCLFSEKEARLIADALQAYQEWKTALGEYEKSEGQNTTNGFYQKNWADLNEKLITSARSPYTP